MKEMTKILNIDICSAETLIQDTSNFCETTKTVSGKQYFFLL